ncbi:MAG: hypothetical protein IPM80_00045 [Proteobacteria bacterium]|nr:hypothetical protein [Pseudomonadota bacterium]
MARVHLFAGDRPDFSTAMASRWARAASRLYCTAMIACLPRLAFNALVLRLSLLLVCLAVCAPAMAVPTLPGTDSVEAASAATPSLPDPRNLDPEWWNYFAVGEPPTASCSIRATRPSSSSSIPSPPA